MVVWYNVETNGKHPQFYKYFEISFEVGYFFFKNWNFWKSNVIYRIRTVLKVKVDFITSISAKSIRTRCNTTVFSLRAGSRRISPSIAVFIPAILFPTKIDRYFSGTSCTCFGIVFILVPYLIVCALARFSDMKWETSHYSI
jgi:hypothetical protein